MNSYLIEDYCNITKECDINNLSSVFTYYLADKTNNHIISKSNEFNKIYDIDIKSAFPNICRILFGEDHPFVQKIFEIEDKLERNKFISITLTYEKNLPFKISDLNIYSKILILGYIYSLFDNITILEYKKDGVIFIGNVKTMIERNSILDVIEKYNIEFKHKIINTYLRFNRTSIIYYDNNSVDIKGLYKSLPIFLKNIIISQEIPSEIKKIYSRKYFDIIKLSYLKDLLRQYYTFDNDNYLTMNGGLKPDINYCHPPSYLVYILYPFMNLMKLFSF